MTTLGCILLPLNACAPALPESQELGAIRDEVLGQFFTDEAAEALGEVPIRYGDAGGYGGMAMDDTPEYCIAGIYLGIGCGRQIVINAYPSRDLVFHELIHQAENLGLISRRDFLLRLREMRADPDYAIILDDLDSSVSGNRATYVSSFPLGDIWWNLFGFTASEQIAYLATDYAFRTEYGLPDYMLAVFERTLSRAEPSR